MKIKKLYSVPGARLAANEDLVQPEIIVAATKRDAHTFSVQKYNNNESWNTVGGAAPNGVCATRWLRKTKPDLSKLSPLAAFLVNHCPGCVAGKMPAFNSGNRVQIFNGKTEADRIKEEAENCHVNHICFSQTNRAGESPLDQAKKYARGLIHCYGLENIPCKIDDWLFSIIQPEQTDEEYWGSEAEKIIDIGGKTVKIGEAEFTI